MLFQLYSVAVEAWFTEDLTVTYGKPNADAINKLKALYRKNAEEYLLHHPMSDYRRSYFSKELDEITKKTMAELTATTSFTNIEEKIQCQRIVDRFIEDMARASCRILVPITVFAGRNSPTTETYRIGIIDKTFNLIQSAGGTMTKKSFVPDKYINVMQTSDKPDFIMAAANILLETHLQQLRDVRIAFPYENSG